MLWPALIRSPNVSGTFQKSVFHLVRVVLVIWHTSQFGSLGKCVNTLWCPFALESLVSLLQLRIFCLASAQVSLSASVTTERGLVPTTVSALPSYSARGAFLTSTASSSIKLPAFCAWLPPLLYLAQGFPLRSRVRLELYPMMK